MRRLLSCLFACLTAVAQTTAGTITISGDQSWTDTGIDLRAGDFLVITADGTMNLPQGKSRGPDGQARGFRDLLKAYPANDAGLGALIGRIWIERCCTAVPSRLPQKEMPVLRAGRLFCSWDAFAFPPKCGSILVLSWKIISSKQTPTNGVEDNRRMSFTVFLGNLPIWVTADDIRGWLTAENLVADAIKVIRNPETQESKGFAFIEAPNADEMNAIIRRFDRAPLEDRLLRANPAQPPKPRGQVRSTGGPSAGGPSAAPAGPVAGPVSTAAAPPAVEQRPRRGKRANPKRGAGGPQSAFAEELAKAL